MLFIEAEVIVTFHAAPDVALTRYAKLAFLVHDVGKALFLLYFTVSEVVNWYYHAFLVVEVGEA